MALLNSLARRLPGRWVLAVGAAVAMLAAVAGAEAPASISAENQLKAVFLFNFAQFVDWPRQAFPEAQAPIVIGVLGDDPFGTYLDGLVQKEKIGDHTMAVRRSHRLEDLAGCHILFISRSEAGRYDKVIAELKGRAVLTVGDADGFNRQGGMVRFATENGKIQLRINLAAAKAVNLTVSSKLLAHATVVPPGKD